MPALMISPGNFSIFDWIVIVILVYSIAISAMKGFVREALGLVSLVVAILLASWFYRPVSTFFKDVVKTENLALFCGFSVVFLGTLLAGFVAIWIIKKFTQFAQIQWFDRLLGAAFGFIRGWALGSILFLVLTSFKVQTDRVDSSQLAPYLMQGARLIAVATPYDMKARFLVEYRRLEQIWHSQQ